MAEDPGKIELLREALGEVRTTEKRMFGGTCFMLRGHMLCGTVKAGAIFRVGKGHDAAALALPGVRPMNFTGKEMSGFVEVDEMTLAEEATVGALMALALDFNKSLPPK
ncbi:MAG: TfoX/Sxy family protein [Paracoccaceae bacterium]